MPAEPEILQESETCIKECMTDGHGGLGQSSRPTVESLNISKGCKVPDGRTACKHFLTRPLDIRLSRRSRQDWTADKREGEFARTIAQS